MGLEDRDEPPPEQSEVENDECDQDSCVEQATQYAGTTRADHQDREGHQ